MDRTPAEVVASTPAADAVNVEASSIRIRFSEYVNPQSFVQAFSLTPEMEGRLEFGWRGRAVTIDLPEDLRPNTTYIVTVDNNLRDAHGVSLQQPITLAFSTGPTINRGRIAGRVIDPDLGEGVAGIDVFAYAVTDSSAPAVLPERPDYRTQTNASGQFELSYLNEQPYFVIALADRNRNRQPDPSEAFAAPPRPVIVADTAAAEIELPWLATRLDTVPPEPDRIRTLSNQRLEVRFTEPVHLVSLDPATWTLQDSLSGQEAAIQALYTLPDATQEVFVETEPLEADRIYRLRPAAVADTAGHAVRPVLRTFTATAEPDTATARFLSFVPDTSLAVADSILLLMPGRPFGVRLSQPVAAERLRQAVSLQDTVETAIPFSFTTPDGTAYHLVPTLPAKPGYPLEILVDAQALSGADTVYTRTVYYLPPDELGEISGYVSAAALDSIVVELYRSTVAERTPFRVAVADATGRFYFSRLPEGAYRLRAFVDRDADLEWGGGRLQPYEPAEPVAWTSDSLRVRARWETALPDMMILVGG